MNPTNIGLWLVLVALIAIVPIGYIMSRRTDKPSAPAE